MTTTAASGDSYYVFQGRRVPLPRSRSFAAVRWPRDQQVHIAFAAGGGSPNRRDGIHYLPHARTMLLPQEMLGPFVLGPGGPREWPVFERDDGSLLIPDDFAVVSREGLDEAAAGDLARSFRAEVVSTPSQIYPHYLFRAGDGDAIRLANLLAERQGLAAQPGFTYLLSRRFACVRSAALRVPPPHNWALERTKVREAWKIHRGSPSVVTAILDVGVDVEHDELKANLAPGYDAHDNDEDAAPGQDPTSEQAHGTACAGIVAALGNNDLGIVGIAPASRVAPYRIGNMRPAWIELRPGSIARSIHHAANAGVPILANSYSLTGDTFDDIEAAIRYAVTERGCLFVAAAGNDDKEVHFPANSPHAMAVAATNLLDERCGPADWTNGGSCKGSGISVAAPGSHVWTTDLRGELGYNSGKSAGGVHGDYTLTFAGTSAACPFVAGVAALVRSVAPRLGAPEMRGILEATADKVGAERDPYVGGRNQSLGHGRVNALAAVELAFRERA